MDLCSTVFAGALAVFGGCADNLPDAPPMPQNEPDAAAFAFPKDPKPEPPPPPKPEPQPKFRPLVVEKTIYVQQPAPTPAPVPEQTSEEQELNTKRAKFREALETAFTIVPAKTATNILKSTGGDPAQNKGKDFNLGRTAGTRPLDLHATIRTRTDAKYSQEGVDSSLPVDNARIITSDRYINVQLEGGINTQLDGEGGNEIVLVVTDDFFGAHGRNILIPKGSRAECSIKGLGQLGSSRAYIQCRRLLIAESRVEIFEIEANGVDEQGHQGISGIVDERFDARFGTATRLAVISALVRGAMASLTVSESNSNIDNAITTSGEELSQRFGEISASVVEKTVNLKPFLKKAQGSPLVLRPSTDWYLKQVE